MKKIFAAVLLCLVLTVAVAGVAFAQTVPAAPRTIPSGITTATGFIALLNDLTDWLFVIWVLIAVLFIVVAGLQFIMAQGDPTAISKARMSLIWAAVGIGVALLARGLPEAVENLLTGQ